jgi:hypothetical protein
LARWTLKPALRQADKQNRTIATDGNDSELPSHQGRNPIFLSRNGKEFTAEGETNVRAGSEYKVTTERPSVNISRRLTSAHR